MSEKDPQHLKGKTSQIIQKPKSEKGILRWKRNDAIQIAQCHRVQTQEIKKDRKRAQENVA